MRKPLTVILTAAAIAAPAIGGFFAFTGLSMAQPPTAGDPALEREWVTIAVQGGGKAWVMLRPNGTFTMRTASDPASKTKAELWNGSYTVSKGGNYVPGMGQDQKTVDLLLPVHEASRIGMTKSDIKASGLEGRSWVPFHRFLYDPEIPVLTDLIGMHLAPVGEEQAVIQKMSAGANPLRLK